MFESLEMTKNRYEEVSIKLSDPTVADDQEQFRKLMKEYKTLTPVNSYVLLPLLVLMKLDIVVLC